MMNTRKPASPFASMGQPQGGQSGGQYGANASPGGNAWGQQFMQQYGAPPGQMRDEWQAYKTQNGFGMGGMGGQPSPQPPQMGGMDMQMMRRNPMQSWLAQRPQFGGGQPTDPRAMMMAWLAQRPRGLLGG